MKYVHLFFLFGTYTFAKTIKCQYAYVVGFVDCVILLSLVRFMFKVLGQLLYVYMLIIEHINRKYI